MSRFVRHDVNALFPSLRLKMLVNGRRAALLFPQCFLFPKKTHQACHCGSLHRHHQSSLEQPKWMKTSKFYIYFLIHFVWIYHIVTNLLPELCPLWRSGRVSLWSIKYVHRITERISERAQCLLGIRKATLYHAVGRNISFIVLILFLCGFWPVP